MADLKISELSALAGSNLVAADALAIVDDSASETKKITVSDLIANGVTVISDDTIPGAKILFGAGDIATAALADAAVTTAKVADDAITAAKLGNESTVDLVTTLPGAGGFTGQLALDTDDNKLYIWDGSAWQSLKAAGSVNTVSGSTTGEINIVSSVSGDTVTLSATIDDTTSANQFLAGPTGAAGAVGYRVIDGSDLPVATSSAKGGVVVNGEGLRMDANTIEVDNDITASATHHVVTYNAKGLITGGRVLAASDLPIATTSAVGGVIPSTGLTVDGSGNLTIDNSVTADTYTKVTVAATGLVTAGSTLAAGDLPNHSADLLTSGNIPLARIADNLVTGAKLADYASAKIGETNPTADYIGQLFFNPLTRDLSLWDGNVFQPIGISAGEIVFAGTYNATTNLLSSVTSDGTGAGFVVGQALPAASGTNKNFYVVVDVGGTGTSPAPAVALAPPDFILSTGTEYKLIDVSETVTAQVASNVGFTPVGTIAANNVQTAIAEVDTEKVAKAGDTMTGNLNLGEDVVLTFEGATDNAFETTLTVVDPTADNVLSLPNNSGTLVSTGDTGSVTSTMLTDGTIVNADINASAEIAVSKLANGTARQLLQTASNGSDVEFTSNVDVPGTLDVTGAATLDSTLGVAGLISANGKVSFPLGSASVPSLLPGTDTNTGIFSPGADALAITTGGTQRVTVDSSGKVGVNTSSPSDNGSDTMLAVKRNASGESASIAIHAASNAASLIRFADGTSTAAERNAGSLRVDHSSGSMQFSLQDSEKLRIDSSGRLLVGTAAGAYKLVVSGGVATTGIVASILNPVSGGNSKIHFSDNATYNWTAGTVGNAFAITPTEASSTAGTPALFINSSSNVGIGTTSPGQLLHLNSSASTAIQISDGTNNQFISSIKTAGNFANGSTVGDILIRGQSGFAVSSNNGSSVALRIDSSGKIQVTGTRGGSLQPSDNDSLELYTSATGGSANTGSGLTFYNHDSSGFEMGGTIQVAKENGTANDTASYMRFATRTNGSSASERMRIDSSGRLLLGTTNAGSNGTADDLVVANDSSASDQAGITIRGGTSGRSQVFFSDGTSGDAEYRGMLRYDHSEDSMQFRTAATERLRIDSSGKVGIGTTNPQTGLHISDGSSLAGPQTTGAGRLTIQNSSSADIQLMSANTGYNHIFFGDQDDANAGVIYYQHNSGVNAMVFTTNAAERLRIDSSGRLLLGATAPVSGADANGLLQVSQNVGSNTCIIVAENTASSGNLSCFRARLRNSNPNNIFSAFLQCDASTGGSKAVIRSNGGLANYSANNVNLSDRNVKKDITAAADTWDCIKEWEIVNFRYKDQPDNADLNLGVIAQQVAESCPEVLTIFQEAKEATETEPAQEERLGVKEQQMHWMAIKALQEAIAKIETLEQRLSDAGIA